MASAIADYLAPTPTPAAAGVTRIWGVTGDSLNGLSDKPAPNRRHSLDAYAP